MHKKKLYIRTYGCQMNVYDSERMAELALPLGYHLCESPDEADLVIFNTCHIREKAAEKLYSDLGRIAPLKRMRAERSGAPMLLAVAGCVGQAEGEHILRRAPYVDMVLGPQSYHRLPEMIGRALRDGGHAIALDFAPEEKFDQLPEAYQSQGKAAFLSVQEGCDKFCTFCVVPYTRGAEFSRPVAAILREARHLVEESGVVELTLLGQNVNAYHGEDERGREVSLAGLIRRLAAVEGLARIRYTTSHPCDMTDELIALHGEEPKLMPYLHLPVQSGSDRILQRMNRRHKAQDYLQRIAQLRAVRPDMAISSDFIVGFPGETEEDFTDTLALVEQVEYASAFSFAYSPRPGTPAAEAEQVPEPLRADRLQRLQKLLNRQRIAFNARTVGRVLPVLLERPGKYPGQLIGKSPYMQSVCVEDARCDIGDLLTVRITAAHANSLSGVPDERNDAVLNEREAA